MDNDEFKTKAKQVVSDFIAAHKNNNFDDWALSSTCPDTPAYLEIYYKLESGVFGEVTENSDGTEFSIEISGHESATGNPIIFEWEI